MFLILFFSSLIKLLMLFFEAKDLLQCVRIREHQQRYKEVVEVFDMVNMRIEALEVAKRYIKGEVNTSPDMKTFWQTNMHHCMQNKRTSQSLNKY